ncbi:MAG TPA: aromatic-ring-hydroxylating dioxygenase subunit beta [Alphaproteobacteria bacterium]
MADRELYFAVEQFMYREARLLDERRFDAWLDLFADDATYWMPARETRPAEDKISAPDELALIADDKPFLVQRVNRLQSPLAHAERPPSRTRRFISNIEIVGEANGAIEVHSNLLLYQSRLERTESMFVGKREDKIRRKGDSFEIAARKVLLDQTLLPRSLSVLF